MHISGLDVGPDLNTAIAQIKEHNRRLVNVSALDYNWLGQRTLPK